MGQNFLPDTVNQILMFPPSLHDWLPEGHLARFLVDVVSALDLSAIYASYSSKDGRGQAAYAPEMMVRLLLYGYATGVYSSRKIQARTYEDVGFRFLSGDQHPDHATIAEFRQRHLEALASLFMQALLLCEEAGLVKLGHVAIDGAKIKANARVPGDRSSSVGWNAGKHKAMSYERMGETEQRLKQEIDALLKQADETPCPLFRLRARLVHGSISSQNQRGLALRTCLKTINPSQEQVSEGDVDHSFCGGGAQFVVFGEATRPVQPSKGALDDPALGQNLK